MTACATEKRIPLSDIAREYYLAPVLPLKHIPHFATIQLVFNRTLKRALELRYYAQRKDVRRVYELNIIISAVQT